MKIAIAGASGFIGQLLLQSLKSHCSVIALGRSAQPDADGKRDEVEWRRCDLFSILQTEKALEGVETAFYLVHSMLPTAKLMQSRFENADLLLADNFSRAAKRAGVKNIIYLGGLIPPHTPNLSRHLLSRLEVESALAHQEIPVTVLRSGLILGAKGSSFQILYLLVKRLPVMICPKWTSSLTQTIDAKDVVNLLSFCAETPATQGKVYEIGGPDVVTYRDLMAEVARGLKVKRRFFSVPFFSPGLSRLWIQLITGASRNLVGPLVQSLRHEMVVHNGELLTLYGKPLLDLRSSLSVCLNDIRPSLRKSTADRQSALRRVNTVRSIQRLPQLQGKNAEWTAAEYFRWLPRFFSPLIRVQEDRNHQWSFRVAGMKTPLLSLELSPQRSSPDRQLFYIRGGLLVKNSQPQNSRLEFHDVLNGKFVLAAIHDFIPALPWPIYKVSQALIHLQVMNRFRKHLTKLTTQGPTVG
jgi:uncharacterized protein YbjT (DUF2867 family)